MKLERAELRAAVQPTEAPTEDRKSVGRERVCIQV